MFKISTRNLAGYCFGLVFFISCCLTTTNLSAQCTASASNPVGTPIVLCNTGGPLTGTDAATTLPAVGNVDVYLLVNSADIIVDNQASPALLIAPANAQSACPVTNEIYQVYTLQYQVAQGISITNGTSSIDPGSADVFTDDPVLGGGDAFTGTPSLTACMSLSAPGVMVTVQPPILADISAATTNCAPDNLTFSTTFQLCGGSGTYDIVTSPFGTVSPASGDNTTTFTLSGVPSGVTPTVAITDNTAPTPCLGTQFVSSTTCIIPCSAVASAPSGTDILLCSPGGAILTTDAALNTPQVGFSDVYLLVRNSDNVIVDNAAVPALLTVPANTDNDCTTAANDAYTIYSVQYDALQGILITNNTSTIIEGNGNVFTDLAGDPYEAPATAVACMDLSDPGLQVSVQPPVIVTAGTAEQSDCTPDGLFFSTTFTICGGSGTYPTIVSSLGTLSPTSGTDATTFTVSNIPSGATALINVLDDSAPVACTAVGAPLNTVNCLLGCTASASTPSGTPMEVCSTGGVLATTDAAVNLPQALYTDLYLLVDADGIIQSNAALPSLLVAPINTNTACPAMDDVYQIYNLQYETLQGLTPITNGTTTIDGANGQIIQDGDGDDLEATPSTTACMDLSAAGAMITVLNPVIVTPTGTPTCAPDNLTYSTDFMVCGGSGTFTVVATLGTVAPLMGDETTTFTVSGVPSGVATTVTAVDNSVPPCPGVATALPTATCLLPCAADAVAPTGTDIELCNTGGPLVGTDAMLNLPPRPLYTDLYLLVDAAGVIHSSAAAPALLIAPMNTQTTCPATSDTYQVYNLRFETIQGLAPIIDGTTSIDINSVAVLTDLNGDPLLASPTNESCLDVSAPGITVTVQPPVIVTPSTTTTCAANNLTYSTSFTVCGGSGTYPLVVATLGTLDMASGDNTTTFTVSGIPTGVQTSITVTDDTAPLPCVSPATLLNSDDCLLGCTAQAGIPSGTNMELCSTGGLLVGTDAMINLPQPLYTDLYLLVRNSDNVIIDNELNPALLNAPANNGDCTAGGGDVVYTIYNLNYETLQGINIVNGVSTINVGGFTDDPILGDEDNDGNPDAYVDPATEEACMDLSPPGITVTVHAPIVVTPSAMTTCAPDNLTYETTFTVCGGSGTYPTVVATLGTLSQSSGDNTTTFTVSGIPTGVPTSITVLDNSMPLACTSPATLLNSDQCLLSCTAMAVTPSGTNIELCDLGGPLVGTDAMLNIPPQPLYGDLYLLVDENDIIQSNAVTPALLIAPANTGDCSAGGGDQVYTVYHLNYELTQGFTIVNGTSSIDPNSPDVFTDGLPLGDGDMDGNFDPYVDPPTEVACMDLSEPGITVTVHPPVVVIPSATTTCAPNNLTYTTTFTVCGGSGTYPTVIASLGTLDMTSGNNITTFTVSGIPTGVPTSISVVDDTSPIPCSNAGTLLNSDMCLLTCTAAAATPSGTDIVLCDLGGPLVGTDAMLNLPPQPLYTDIYLLVDENDIIVANALTPALLIAPANTSDCSDAVTPGGDENYTVYNLNYETLQGIFIVNGTSSIDPASPDVFTDDPILGDEDNDGNPDAFTGAPTEEACMALSAPGIMVTVQSPITIIPSTDDPVCDALGLTYTTTFMICGGSGNYPIVLSTLGTVTPATGNETTVFTVSGIPATTPATITVTDDSSPIPCVGGPTNLNTSDCLLSCTASASAPSGTNMTLCSTGGPLVGAIANINTPQPLYTDIYLLVNQAGIIVDNALNPALLIAPMNTQASCPATDEVYTVYNLQYETLQGISITNNVSSIDPASPDVFTDDPILGDEDLDGNPDAFTGAPTEEACMDLSTPGITVTVQAPIIVVPGTADASDCAPNGLTYETTFTVCGGSGNYSNIIATAGTVSPPTGDDNTTFTVTGIPSGVTSTITVTDNTAPVPCVSVASPLNSTSCLLPCTASANAPTGTDVVLCDIGGPLGVTDAALNLPPQPLYGDVYVLVRNSDNIIVDNALAPALLMAPANTGDCSDAGNPGDDEVYTVYNINYELLGGIDITNGTSNIIAGDPNAFMDGNGDVYVDPATEASCMDLSPAGITVTVQPPIIVTPSPDTNCDALGLTYSTTFTVCGGSGNYGLVLATLGTVSPTNGNESTVFTVSGIPTNAISTVTVTDNSAPLPCTNLATALTSANCIIPCSASATAPTGTDMELCSTGGPLVLTNAALNIPPSIGNLDVYVLVDENDIIVDNAVLPNALIAPMNTQTTCPVTDDVYTIYNINYDALQGISIINGTSSIDPNSADVFTDDPVLGGGDPYTGAPTAEACMDLSAAGLQVNVQAPIIVVPSADTNCDPDGLTYSTTFTVCGGSGTYPTIISTLGTVSPTTGDDQTTFTVSGIPTGTPAAITVTDDTAPVPCLGTPTVLAFTLCDLPCTAQASTPTGTDMELCSPGGSLLLTDAALNLPPSVGNLDVYVLVDQNGIIQDNAVLPNALIAPANTNSTCPATDDVYTIYNINYQVLQGIAIINGTSSIDGVNGPIFTDTNGDAYTGAPTAEACMDLSAAGLEVTVQSPIIVVASGVNNCDANALTYSTTFTVCGGSGTYPLVISTLGTVSPASGTDQTTFTVTGIPTNVSTTITVTDDTAPLPCTNVPQALPFESCVLACTAAANAPTGTDIVQCSAGGPLLATDAALNLPPQALYLDVYVLVDQNGVIVDNALVPSLLIAPANTQTTCPVTDEVYTVYNINYEALQGINIINGTSTIIEGDANVFTDATLIGGGDPYVDPPTEDACMDLSEAGITVTVQAPVIITPSLTTMCDPGDLTYTTTFTVCGGSGTYPLVLSTLGTVSPTSGTDQTVFTVSGIPTLAPAAVTVADDTAPLPCTSVPTTLTTTNCLIPCTAQAATPSGTDMAVCSTGGPLVLTDAALNLPPQPLYLDVYVLVDQNGIIQDNALAPAALIAPANTQTTCPVTGEVYTIYNINYDALQGIDITNGTTSIDGVNGPIFTDSPTLSNGDPYQGMPTMEACMDLSDPGVQITVQAPVIVTPSTTVTCAPDGLTFSTDFTVCGGSGTYPTVISTLGTVNPPNGDDQTTFTVSGIPMGLIATVTVLDDTTPLPCTSLPTNLATDICILNCTASANAPTGTDLALCSDGGLLIGTDAALNLPPSVLNADVYILVDEDGIIIDNALAPGLLSAPANTNATCPAADDVYTVYNINYQLTQGIMIQNGVSTIIPGDPNVFTDNDGDPFVDPATMDACMDLSDPGITVTVQSPIIVDISNAMTMCDGNNLTYSTTFMICGGSGTYNVVLSVPGTVSPLSGDETTVFTASNIPTGTMANVTVTDNTFPLPCISLAQPLASTDCLNCTAAATAPTGTPVALCNDGGLIGVTDAALNLPPQPLYLDVYVLVDENDVIIDNALLPSLLTAPANTATTCPADDDVYTIYNINYQALQGITIVNGISTIIPGDANVFTDGEGDSFVVPSTPTACMDLSDPGVTVTVQSPIIVDTSNSVETCDALNLTYSTTFMVCGGSGNYAAVIPTVGTIDPISGDETTVFTVSNIPTGVTSSVIVTDDTSPLPCTTLPPQPLNSTMCMNCTAAASDPTGTDFTVCSDGGLLALTDAALNLPPQLLYTDIYLLVRNSDNVIVDNQLVPSLLTAPANTQTTCPVTDDIYTIYNLQYQTLQGIAIINGTSTIIEGDPNVFTDANGDPYVDPATGDACMDLSGPGVQVNVQAPIIVTPSATTTCDANGITYSTTFTICGGSGTYPAVVSTAGVVTPLSGDNTTLFTVNNIPSGVTALITVTDDTAPLPCTSLANPLNAANCPLMCSASASAPTGTDIAVCSAGGALLLTDAAVNFPQLLYTDIYLLVDQNGVIVDNELAPSLLDAPENTAGTCPADADVYTIYNVQYETLQGIQITNGLSTIIEGDPNVFTDGMGDPYVDPATTDACMDLSDPGLQVTVQAPLIVNPSTETTCDPSNLLYSTTFTICGGSGNYTAVVAAPGIVSPTMGDETTIFTVSNIPAGTTSMVTVLDSTTPTPCSVAGASLTSADCIFACSAAAATPSGTDMGVCSTGGALFFTDAAVNFPPQPLYTDLYLLVDQGGVIIDAQVAPSLLIAPMNNSTTCPATDDVYTIYNLNYETLQGISIQNGVSTIIPGDVNVFRDGFLGGNDPYTGAPTEDACMDLSDPGVEITVQAPVIVNASPNTMCDPNGLTYSTTFTICGGSGNYDLITATPGTLSPATGDETTTFTVSDIPIGVPSIVNVADDTAPAPCTSLGNALTASNCIFVCPTIGSVSSASPICSGDNTTSLTASGLENMSAMENGDADFGIEFVFFTGPVAAPYVGGTSLGVVTFANLTNGNTEAVLNNVAFPVASGTYEVYAILTPTPFFVTCRPSATTSVQVIDTPDATINAAGPFCEMDGIQTLTAATLGGTLSGTGIVGGTNTTGEFDPAIANLGANTITYTVTVNGCESTDMIDVTVLENPDIASIIGTNPTACLASDGSITITLNNGTAGDTYAITYDDDGVQQMVAANLSATNTLEITGLNAGTYDAFVITAPNGCDAMDATSIMLSDPTFDITDVARTDPSACLASDGSVTLTIDAGTPGDTYDITYDDDGVMQTTTAVLSATNTLEITGLNAGVYDNFMATSPAGCTAGSTEVITLVDPNFVINSIVGTDPMTCNGSDGLITITIMGGAAGDYTITYDDDGVGQTTTATLSATNTLEITGLNAGDYDNFMLTAPDGCSAASTDVITLNDAALMITSVTGTGPTSCGGSEGIVTIALNAAPGDTYTINYDDDGTPQTTTAVVTAMNTLEITGLDAGIYDNISVSSASGCAATSTESVTLSDPNLLVTGGSTNNPSACMAADGSITLFLNGASGGSYDVMFDFNGNAMTQTVTLMGGTLQPNGTLNGATLTLTGLSAGTFNNFNVTENGTTCTASFAVDLILMDGCMPDLEITKSNNPTGPVEQGDQIVYTITLVNNGNGPASNVVVNDAAPTNTTYVNGSAMITLGTGTVDSEDPLMATFPTIAAGETVNVQFIVSVDAGTPNGTTIVNIANYSEDGGPLMMSNQVDNTVNAGVVLGDKTVDFQDDNNDGLLNPGEQANYTIVVTNNGNANATNVAVSDMIPPGTTYVGGSLMTTQGTTDDSGDPLTVAIGTLAPNASATVTFSVVVDNPFNNMPSEISNQGIVSADGQLDSPTDDPNNPTNEPVIAGDPGDPTVTGVDMNIEVMVDDPCQCLNNESEAGDDGQFSELIEVTGPAGMNWVLVSADGLFQPNSPAPPAAPTPFPANFPLTEVSPGVYQLEGIHVDAVGFTVTLSDGNQTIVFPETGRNTCFYPNAFLTGIVDGDSFCEGENGNVTVTGNVVNNPAGNIINFEIVGETDFTVNGDELTFDPADFDPGTYTILFEFDAEEATTNDPSNLGCQTSAEAEFSIGAANVILCRPPVNTVTDPGECQAVVNPLPPVILDENSPIINVSHSPSGPFQLGTTLITWTVESEDGCAQTCQQSITVNDTEKPEINCGNAVYWYTSWDDCGFPSTLLPETTATDNCSGNVTITSDNIQPFYGPGSYMVNFTATDAFGNQDMCMQWVKVYDTTKPKFTSCPEDIVVIAGSDGTATATWPMPTAMDNCPADLWFFSNHDSGDSFPTGITEVIYQVYDGYGNVEECTFTVTVVDAGTSALVAGSIWNENADPAQDVEVNINGTNGMSTMQMTDADGNFVFNVPLNGDYTITPAKDINMLNGVSTYDLFLISEHILFDQLLDSPYKMIAADANKSGTISTLDIVQLRKVILLVNETLPNNTSWRFVDANFEFTDPMNPFADDFPEITSINNLAQAVTDANFMAIKIGDVNGNAAANNLLGADDRTNWETLALHTKDVAMTAGETYEIPLYAHDFNHIGFQFTLDFATDMLEFVNLEAGLAKADNFGLALLDEGAITASWMDNAAIELAKDQPIVTLTFTAKMDGNLRDALSISSRYTVAEAYRATGEFEDLALEFGTTTATPFRLYQNAPNPFTAETTIDFTLPEATAATLTITDVSGRVVEIVDGDYAKGYNKIILTNDKLPNGGVYYYRLTTATDAGSGKMILNK